MKKRYLKNRKFLYLTLLFINYDITVDTCQYLLLLHKTLSKNDHVLPYYDTSNKSKLIDIVNII